MGEETVPVEITQLVARHRDLEARLSALESAMRQAASELPALPDTALAHAILESRAAFEALAGDLGVAGGALGLALALPETRALLAEAMSRVLEAATLATSAKRLRDEAVESLGDVLRLGSQEELPPLQDVKQAAESLLNDFASLQSPGESALSDLLKRLQPFLALLRLVADQEGLDFETSHGLFKSVNEVFHPHVAFAALKGRLRVDDELTRAGSLTTPKPPPQPQKEVASTVGESAPPLVERGPVTSKAVVAPPQGFFASSPSAPAAARPMRARLSRNAATRLAQPSQLPGLPPPPPLATPQPGGVASESKEARDSVEIQAPLVHLGTDGETKEVAQAVSAPPQAVVFAPTEVEASPLPIPPQEPAPQDPEVASPEVVAMPARGLEPSEVASRPEPRVEGPPSGEEHPEAPESAAAKAVWSLLLGGHAGLAYVLRRSMKAGGTEAPPAWLLHAVALAPSCLHGVVEVIEQLKAAYPAFAPDVLQDLSQARRTEYEFLLAAAALQPTLVAPETGATDLLRALNCSGWTSLWHFKRLLEEFGVRGQGADPRLLRRAKTTANWKEESEKLRQDAHYFLTVKAPHRQTKFGAATRVWHHWCEPNGLLKELLGPILQNEYVASSEHAALVAELTNDVTFRRRVDDVDRKVLLRRHGGPITAAPYSQLRSFTQEAMVFLQRWKELAAERPGQRRDYMIEEVEKLRQQLQDLRPQLQDELGEAVRGGLAAAPLLQRAIEALYGLFDEGGSLETRQQPLFRDMLRTELRLDEQLLPLDETDESIEAQLTALAAAPERPWDEVFQDHLVAQNLENAQRILEMLAASGLAPDDVEAMQRALDDRQDGCKELLQREVKQALVHVEKVVAAGLLKESDRASYVARVTATGEQDHWRYHERLRSLAVLRGELDDLKNSAANEVRERLLTAGIRPDQPAYARIERALEGGDLLVANEYIDMAMRGEDPPDPSERPDAFRAFFPERVESVARYLDSPEASSLRHDIAARRGVAGLSLDAVPAAPLEAATQTVDAWYEAKRARGLTPEQATRILTFLGLAPRNELSVGRVNKHARIDLATDPLEDRRRCPVPAYGSAAKGRYLVIGVFGEPTEEDLLHELPAATLDAPQIVLYFGVLGVEARRNLAHLCRELSRTVIVVDEALLLFLCAEAGSRLPVMFSCTLPFTSVEPYVIAPGYVPPELFAGREQELRDVLSPTGSAVIYGGRQLGKTALLRQAERRFHAPERQHYAIWIDLKGQGINADADNLWTVLAAALKAANIFSAQTPGLMTGDAFVRKLKEWFQADDRRRVLLLLDEADVFLEVDGSDNFRRADRLRELMVDTEYRFKAVLAGLHNVQRSTQVANTAMLHFGIPKCIGPLMQEEDGRAARELVERPFASLGYCFETPDLVTRILSQTNYFPSLIQLYCTYLLRHISQATKQTFNRSTSPPYVIKEKHVEEAYQTSELREAIRYRFVGTIGLDARYEVIAYAIALETLEDRQKGMVEGFHLTKIRAEALSWWSEGFALSSTEDAVCALLDEMVGLGILRRASPGHYALRSPNLLVLLGDQDEIYQQLVRPREVPPVFDPVVFHGEDPKAKETERPWSRNPLTLKQAYELRTPSNSIVIACGCEAAGLDALLPFLAADHGDGYHSITDAPSIQHFEQRLGEILKKKRPTETNTVIAVAPGCNWTREWVDLTFKRLAKLTSGTAFVKVVFVASPSVLWRLCRQQGAGALGGMSLLTLAPWHESAVQHWLNECDLHRVPRQRLSALTGNWAQPLQQFFLAARDNVHRWETILEESERVAVEVEATAGLVRAFGCDVDPPGTLLQNLAAYGPIDPAEFVDLVEAKHAQYAAATWRWAELLGLVRPVRDRLWALDEVVSRVLHAESTRS